MRSIRGVEMRSVPREKSRVLKNGRYRLRKKRVCVVDRDRYELLENAVSWRTIVCQNVLLEKRSVGLGKSLVLKDGVPSDALASGRYVLERVVSWRTMCQVVPWNAVGKPWKEPLSWKTVCQVVPWQEVGACWEEPLSWRTVYQQKHSKNAWLSGLDTYVLTLAVRWKVVRAVRLAGQRANGRKNTTRGEMGFTDVFCRFHDTHKKTSS